MASDDEAGDNISIAVNNADADASLIGTSNILSPEVLSPITEKMRDLGNAGTLTRIELDLAYAAEKLLNLEVLLMHVATRATDFEALSLVNEDISLEYFDELLEFDLLSAILDSEVKQIDDFMTSVQMDIVDAHEKISYCTNLEEPLLELKKKLHDSAESLKKLQDQVSEMRMQSTKFQSTIAFYIQGSGNDEGNDISEYSQILSMDTKLKMQTTEQKRHILRMLEKSLAREMDLENKLSDLVNNEEELLMKMSCAEREISCVKEMAEASTEKLFEAENLAEIFLGVTKELMGKLQISLFNLNSSTKREDQMRPRVHCLEKKIEDSNIELDRVKAFAEASQSQQVSLQSKIGELESVIKELKADLHNAEGNVESAERRCKLLDETTLKLTQEIGCLKNSVEKVVLLEKQLKQSELQLQHAKAITEANQEKETMLYSALGDMENVITDLKAKVVKAERRAETAESNCIILTETNSKLNDTLGFLNKRIECLEESIHQADEAKEITARDLGIHTKVITDLVMQLGMERERLQIQVINSATDLSRNKPFSEDEMGFSVSAENEKDLSKFEAVRTIEASQLSLKYVITAIIILISSVLGVYFFQDEGGTL